MTMNPATAWVVLMVFGSLTVFFIGFGLYSRGSVRLGDAMMKIGMTPVVLGGVITVGWLVLQALRTLLGVGE